MNKKIKVILTADIKKVGKKDDIKEVMQGFAENFLFPQRKAVLYTEKNSQQIALGKARKRDESKLKLRLGSQICEELNKLTLQFHLRKENNKIFGSVSEIDIANSLQENGIKIPVKKRLLDFAPLKKEGNYIVRIRIDNELIANLQVVVKGIQ